MAKKDYIERAKVTDALIDNTSIVGSELEEAVNAICAIPAADVRPVVRGRWIDKCVRDWRCSECGGEIDKVRHVDGYYYDNLPRYCPDCGAVMLGTCEGDSCPIDFKEG